MRNLIPVLLSLAFIVPGMIGTLQAMETIKLLLAETKTTETDHQRIAGPSFSRRLLVFDGESGLFRTVNLRPKQADCAVCSGPESRTIKRLDDVDYAHFCGRGPHDKVFFSSFLSFFVLFSPVLLLLLGVFCLMLTFASSFPLSTALVSLDLTLGETATRALAALCSLNAHRPLPLWMPNEKAGGSFSSSLFYPQPYYLFIYLRLPLFLYRWACVA